MPKIHINGDVYTKLKELAEEQNRSIANMAETILYNVWGKQPSNPVQRKQYPSEELKPPKLARDIPGVELASEAKCKGTHYMSRKDCGKLDCPWKGIK